MRSFVFFAFVVAVAQGAVRRDTAVAIQNAQVGLNFRDNCFASPSGGCKCQVSEGMGDIVTREYDDVSFCKKPVELQTVENKQLLNEEIRQKFGDFKDNCFPNPSGGCRCNVDLGHGETVKTFTADADCRKSVEAVTAEHKKEINEEIKAKVAGFKENCFPMPSGSCKCNEKDGNGNEVVNTYKNADQCRVRSKRDVSVQQQRQPQVVGRVQSKDQSRAGSPINDPVREKAQANYAAVLDELKNKFRGLKEGCYPRPKGCLCVIGKTPEGRDITERRMKDADCKCAEGERGPGCPAA